MALVGKPGSTTPYPDKPTEQSDAKEELLQWLIDLNAERAAEEARGVVVWSCPDFQNPEGEKPRRTAIDTAEGETAVTPVTANKQPWPKRLSVQVRALRDALVAQSTPPSSEQITSQFTRTQTKKVEEVLAALVTLVALGQAQMTEAGRYARVRTQGGGSGSVEGPPADLVQPFLAHGPHRLRRLDSNRSLGVALVGDQRDPDRAVCRLENDGFASPAGEYEHGATPFAQNGELLRGDTLVTPATQTNARHCMPNRRGLCVQLR